MGTCEPVSLRNLIPLFAVSSVILKHTQEDIEELIQQIVWGKVKGHQCATEDKTPIPFEGVMTHELGDSSDLFLVDGNTKIELLLLPEQMKTQLGG